MNTWKTVTELSKVKVCGLAFKCRRKRYIGVCSSLLRQQTIKVSEIRKKSDLLKGVFQKAMGRAEEGCGI